MTVKCGSAIAGTPVDCNAITTGGTDRFTFSWSAPGGDPSSGSGGLFTTAFSLRGTYSVTAIAIDTSGSEGSGSTGVTVSARTLTIDFTFFPLTPSSGQPITFTATGSASSYLLSWDFGDNAAGSGSPVQHTYTVSSTATFDVTLNATDTTGSTGAASHSITVTGPTRPSPVNPSPTSPSPLNTLPGFNWPLAAPVAGNLFMALLALS